MIASLVSKYEIDVYDLTQFDPYAILHSGQIFRYWQKENGWLVVSDYHWAELKRESSKIKIVCDDAGYFYNFFDLSTDYDQIKNCFSAVKIKNAIAFGGGIRILKANFFETVISFIISANNNIKRFTKTLNQLCEKYGVLLPCGYYSFPTLEQCERISIEDFKQLGCGYRSSYLYTAIRQLKQFNFDTLNNLCNEELKKELLQISGVGPKVAACIMLFAFHRLDVAPVDTWIKKAINQLNVIEKENILTGKYAGVVQQYIFYYLQHLRKDFLQ